MKAVMLRTALLLFLLVVICIQKEALSCTIPPYVEIATSSLVSRDELDSQILEGRCFLGCLDNDSTTYLRKSTYLVWPYARLKSSCAELSKVHECTRGCSAWLSLSEAQREEESDCITYCNDNCQQECDGGRSCSNPDTNDPWLTRSDCTIICNQNQCQQGCQIASDYLASPFIVESDDNENGLLDGSGAPLLSLSSPPLSPQGPPEVTLLPPAQPLDFVGIYSISFHNAEPSTDVVLVNISTLPITAAILRIADLNTSEIHYLWLTNFEDPISLTPLICHEVSFSFAVLNQHGISKYSQPMMLLIMGDDRRLPIPNPPQNFSFKLEEDTRIGFFGRMIINISWRNPSSTLYLDYYLIVLQHTHSRHENETVEVEVDPSINDINSLTFETENSTSLQIVIQQNYVVQISWTIPELWASSADIILKFTLTPRILFIDDSLPTRTYAHHMISFECYKTTYMRQEGEVGNSFFQPQNNSDSFYRFDLVVGWNTTNSLGFLPAHLEVTCIAPKLSPPPSSVSDVTISNVTMLGADEIEVQVKWVPPAMPNGEINLYQICVSLSDDPYTSSANGVCQEAKGDVTTAAVRVNISRVDCLYLSLRPRNLYVYGNWTEPILVEANCQDIAMTTEENAFTVKDRNLTVPNTSTDSVSTAVLASILSVLLVGTFASILIILIGVGIRMLHRRRTYWLTK